MLDQLDLEGLETAELSALHTYAHWCAGHPQRASWIGLLDPEGQQAMQAWAGEHCPDALFLFSDGDASNCAGIYRAGPLRGTVLVLMHDEENLAPHFSSLPAFVDTLMTDTPDVRDFGMLSYAEPPLGTVPASIFDSLQAALLSSEDDSLWRYGPRVLASANYQGLEAELQDILWEHEISGDLAGYKARTRQLLGTLTPGQEASS